MPNINTKPANQVNARALTDNQDYFNYQPGVGSRKRLRFQRSHVPDPLQLRPHSSSPLSTGPAGYKYTPLFLRTPDLESFRYDHGVQFKKHLSFKEVVLCARWHLLLDEDALPSRIKNKSRKSLKAVKHFVRHTIKSCGKSLGGVWSKTKEKISSTHTDMEDVASGGDSQE